MKIIFAFSIILLSIISANAQRVASTHFFYFESSTSILKKPEEKKIIAVCDTISEYKIVSIIVTGHTDDTNTEEENMILSEARAKSVKDILIKNKIPENKISIVAMGETNPLELNSTEKGKARNRRVEVKVVYE